MPDSVVSERPVSVADEALAPSTTPAAASLPGRRATPLVAAVLVVLIVTGIAAALVFATRPHGGAAEPGEAERLAAVQAASTAVVAFTTYDSSTVTKDFAHVQTLATGEFAKQYAAAAPDLEKLITSGKASSKGTVLRAAAVSVAADHAVVILAVDDAVKNLQLPKGTVRNYRFRVTLDRVHGQWLVSALAPVA